VENPLLNARELAQAAVNGRNESLLKILKEIDNSETMTVERAIYLLERFTEEDVYELKERKLIPN
jgi:hypothetical protein